MSTRSVQHATIVIERFLDAPLARAFAVWAHPEGWEGPLEQHEFRVGGQKRLEFRPPDGHVYREDGRYEDIVPDDRTVYAYSIWRGDVRITVSLQTVEFAAEGPGTRMLLTEQLTILDDGDTPAARERGTREWLDRFAHALERSRATPRPSD
jgi:uncharacterized protein YndB with AHSA1/START domain